MSARKRVVFVGASGFGAQCAELARAIPGVELAGIVTAPRQFAISYSEQPVTNVLHADFEKLAQAWGVPHVVMQGSAKDPQLLETLRGWRPDMFLVVGWYHVVPRAWRDLAPAYGMHASLLPAYRGGAPLVWAMINGEREAGITFFKLDEGIDSGEIVGQRAVPILLNDTIATLYTRIEEAGRGILADTLPGLIAGTCPHHKQDLDSGTVMPQRAPADGAIDWGRGSLDIYNFIRAQTRPYPGAFTHLDGQRIHIWQARLFDDGRQAQRGSSLEGGEILGHVSEGPLKGVLVAARNGDHSLLITEASDAAGAQIDLADGGRQWSQASPTRRFTQ